MAQDFDTVDPAAGPRVHLSGGLVEGEAVGGVHRFLGLRYGQDTALTRYRRAGPVSPWPGVVRAVAYANQCPQPPLIDSPVYEGMSMACPDSEDCLFLNIWTPHADATARRPVLVWLHGGGFVMGSGNAHPYDGTRLVTRGDVVLVNITHRLNLFGHLELSGILGPEFADSANVGLLDIVLALEWVRGNIAAFGGDPGNVTIFGESGGGAKVHALLAMPEARGLFHKASIQSGGGGLAITREKALEQAPKLLAALGLDETNAGELLTAPWQRLVEAYTATFAPTRFPYSCPMTDGIHLTRHPFYPDAPPGSAEIPLMVGSCRTEATALLGGFFPHLFHLDWHGLARQLPPFLSEWGIYDTVPKAAERPDEVIATLRQLHPTASASDIFFLAASHAMFIRGAIRTAELHAHGGARNTYVWSLEWPTPIDGGKWGSPHALDVPFFFDTLHTASALIGAGEPKVQTLADQMSEALVAFARSGSPNHPGLPYWPPYDEQTRATIIFDTPSRITRDPHGSIREMFAASR